MRIRAGVIGALLWVFTPVGSVAACAEEALSPLVGFDAVRALVGNTLVYAKPDQPGVELGVYLRLDGSGLAVNSVRGNARVPRAIRWTNLSDGRFCVSEVGGKSWDGDCGVLSINGMGASLTPKTGPAWSGRVLEGDAWNLDPATASLERFVGKAAIAALIGQTMIFGPTGGQGEDQAYYIMPKNRVRRAHNDQPDFDHWALQPDERWSIRGKDDQLCFSGGGWKEDFCATVSIAGDLVTLRHARAGLLHATLAQGDARNLSPAVDAANGKLAAAFVNKTLLLKADDRQAKTDSRMYFQRDGAGLAKRGDRAIEPMTWLLQRDGKLCVVERSRKFRDSDCTKLSIDGDAVTLQAPDRPAISGRLLRGNALGM